MRYAKLATAIVLSIALALAAWRGWIPYSLTETLGFVTGAWCVFLVVVQNIWNFPLGIANTVFFFVLFYEARIYGDAGLQLIYLVLNAHGWYWWLHGGANRTGRRVANASAKHLVVLAVLVVLGTWGLTLALRAVSGSAPLLDAFTSVLSLAAQYLLNWKFIENWYVWIAADVLYIYLYASRGLHLTAVLYFVFLCLCIGGVVEWRKALAGAVEPEPTAA